MQIEKRFTLLPLGPETPKPSRPSSPWVKEWKESVSFTFIHLADTFPQSDFQYGTDLQYIFSSVCVLPG